MTRGGIEPLPNTSAESFSTATAYPLFNLKLSSGPRNPKGIKKEHPSGMFSFFYDPWGNRTPVTAVKGRCLDRLTNGP